MQDTIPICPAQLSQHVALAALQQGRSWVDARVAGLLGNRAAISAALEPLRSAGLPIAGGEGAIYFWARLPPGPSPEEFCDIDPITLHTMLSFC